MSEKLISADRPLDARRILSNVLAGVGVEDDVERVIDVNVFKDFQMLMGIIIIAFKYLPSINSLTQEHIDELFQEKQIIENSISDNPTMTHIELIELLDRLNSVRSKVIDIIAAGV